MRQRYHFMPQTGWLNDPNGLICFRGKYHFFFQHNPYSGFWDSMHWGHAISEDMLHWEFFQVLAESRGEWGYMWECPDFYPIGDKYVLTFSPMGAGDHTAVYLVGDFDYKTGRF